MAKVIRLYVGGRIKNTVFQDAQDTYVQRIRFWDMRLIECSDQRFTTMQPLKDEVWIALDERGDAWTSPQFCQKLTQWVESPLVPCFLIGPSDGLPATIIKSASFCMSFSSMTWPHLMARLLLIEQIYRAQQRILNHPYSFV
jgi:rRNA large subunit m3Psi methyltransferase RlmH